MSKSLTITLVALTALFWGASFNVGKYIVEYLPPLTAASIRFTLASVLILAIMFWKEKNILANIKNNWLAYIIIGVVGVAGFNGLFFLGLKYTSAVNGALIMATNPLVTMLLAAVLLKEPISKSQRAGILLSLVGVLIVIAQGSMLVLLNMKMSLGDGIIFAANVCWAMYGVLGRKLVKDSSPLISTAMTMCTGTIALIFLSGASLFSVDAATLNWGVYGGLIYLAVFCSVLAYLFWNCGIANLGATTTSTFFNLVPVFTVLISLCLGQPVSTIQLVGGALVILGVLISTNMVGVMFPRKTRVILNDTEFDDLELNTRNV
jgi:drug/metabolite transporter (DMT)-like permease